MPGQIFGDYTPITQLTPIILQKGIAVLADLGNDIDSIDLMSKVAELADIVFLNGDLFYDTDECQLKSMFNSMIAPYIGKRIKFISKKYVNDDPTQGVERFIIEWEITTGTPTVKFFATLGNHEYEYELFWKAALQQEKWTYSIDIGNDFHVLCLNTQQYQSPMRTSQQEIESDLENALLRGKKLRIVIYHTPNKGYYDSANVWHELVDKQTDSYYYQELLSWPNAFKNKSAELIVTGHRHLYIRFPSRILCEGKKNTYIVNGCGGKSLENKITGFDVKTAAYHNSSEGFTLITLKENTSSSQPTMTMKFIDKFGNIPLMSPSFQPEIVDIMANNN